jgi:hypothetical protein
MNTAIMAESTILEEIKAKINQINIDILKPKF